jgi:hypothetical protein
MKSLRGFAVAGSLATFLLAGCHVESHKNGKNDNVAISTPFGSMHVKTDDNGDGSSTGLAIYPGAVPVTDSEKSHDSADINMDFGNFHLGVKTASFQTGDSADKVIDFYRKDLARYGDVIECKDNHAVGTPTKTSKGLGCDDKDNHHHVHGKVSVDSRDDIELRAGSEQKQHVVGIEHKDGGIRIGLVMLNLPTNLDSHDSKDSTDSE